MTRISVVVPAHNEAASIERVLQAVLAARPYECIVVDGGSEDGTAETARREGARVLRAARSRGAQLATGARQARGDTLLFLHADTEPPPTYPRDVAAALAGPGVVAGAFRLRIDAPHRSLRVIERLVHLRSRFLQMPYGDQGLFVTADALCRVGGFPEVPAMEDYEVVRRLRRLGRIALCPTSVITSARAWLARGIWRTTAVNQICVAAYRLGVGPDRIARWRGAALPRGG